MRRSTNKKEPTENSRLVRGMGNRLFGIHLGASALKSGRCRRKRGNPAHVIVQEYSCHPAGVLDEAVDVSRL